MMKKFSIVLLGMLVCLCGSGCSYFMLWQISEYEHDETRADREMRALEEERALRMQGDSNYTDEQINAINARSSIGSRGATSRQSKPMTVEELREQQERERAKRRR